MQALGRPGASARWFAETRCAFSEPLPRYNRPEIPRTAGGRVALGFPERLPRCSRPEVPRAAGGRVARGFPERSGRGRKLWLRRWGGSSRPVRPLLAQAVCCASATRQRCGARAARPGRRSRRNVRRGVEASAQSSDASWHARAARGTERCGLPRPVGRPGVGCSEANMCSTVRPSPDGWGPLQEDLQDGAQMFGRSGSSLPAFWLPCHRRAAASTRAQRRCGERLRRAARFRGLVGGSAVWDRSGSDAGGAPAVAKFPRRAGFS